MDARLGITVSECPGNQVRMSQFILRNADCVSGREASAAHPLEQSVPLTGLPVKFSLRFEEQNGHIDTMPDSSGSSAEKNIGKETVSMRAHGHQIATLLLDPFNNLIRRFTVRQFSLGR